MSCCSSAASASLRAHRGVEFAVVAGRVGAELDQVARLVELGQQRARTARRLQMLAAGHVGHHARHRFLDVDGRVVAGLGQLARQHDVAVEDAARRVGDRVLLVVAFGQHGVERGDRAAAVAAVAAALDQLRQLGEARSAGSPWWPAARRWPARSRAAPSRSASGCPSAAARAGRGRGSARRSRWRRSRPACAPAAAHRPARPRRRCAPGLRRRGCPR